jgi:hypothetical protein
MRDSPEVNATLPCLDLRRNQPYLNQSTSRIGVWLHTTDVFAPTESTGL